MTEGKLFRVDFLRDYFICIAETDREGSAFRKGEG